MGTAIRGDQADDPKDIVLHTDWPQRVVLSRSKFCDRTPWSSQLDPDIDLELVRADPHVLREHRLDPVHDAGIALYGWLELKLAVSEVHVERFDRAHFVVSAALRLLCKPHLVLLLDVLQQSGHRHQPSGQAINILAGRHKTVVYTIQTWHVCVSVSGFGDKLH